MKLINNHRQPITLEGGTILAAAGTDGSTREVESITERDRRRHVQTGRVRVVDARAVEEQPARPVKSKKEEN
jgi:hypothetical protein